ncbi:hypothetical protein ACFO5W_07180 [Dyella halodurans]|uniref:Phage tail tape measure protein n=2 Tax=Dyella halodurans TaxID=1920171 RepID=A0ABV9C0J6_9GAMM|nr:hypothetical protein [Dyella halodurans]
MRTEADAAKLEGRIKSIHGQLLKGGLMVGAGVGILAAFKTPLDEAKKFQTEVAKFSLYGMGDQVDAQAVKFAKGMNVIGTSATEAMRSLTEAQGVFRESGLSGSAALDGAKLAAPVLAKIAFATAGLDGDAKEKMHTQSLAMLRFVEMRGGLKDAATFNGIADAGWKAIRSSGGNVNWEQLRQFMARGGVAAQGLTDQALFGKLEPVIGELKGSGAGTAWMTSYNRLIGGVRVPNQVAHLLADNGIWDKSKIEWNSQGGIKRFNGKPLRDIKTLSSDPVEFYEKNILPMYAKLGIKSQEDKGRENLLIFGRTGGAMFSLIDRQLATIHRSVDAQSKALGIDASVKQVGGTLGGKEIDFHAKFNNLLLQTGDVILPMAVRALEILNPMLQRMANWMQAHPRMFGLVIQGLIGLAGALIGFGALNIIAGGFRGLGLALKGIGGLTQLATGLTSVAGGLKALGVAAAAFAAAYAGWKIGTVISDKMDGTKFGDKFSHYNTKYLGAALDLVGIKNDYSLAAKYDGYDQKYNGAAPLPGQAGYVKPGATRSPFIASPTQQTVQVNSTITLDGKAIAKSTTMHQARAAAAPQTGMSGLDSSQGPLPIGATGSW